MREERGENDGARVSLRSGWNETWGRSRSIHNRWPFEHFFQSLCLPVTEWCVKSHEDRVMMDLICMIHGLFLTSHLQDELTWTSSCTELLSFLTLKSQLLSLPTRVWNTSSRWNLFLVRRVSDKLTQIVHGLHLSVWNKVWESWFTCSGTRIFHFVLSTQLDLSLIR